MEVIITIYTDSKGLLWSVEKTTLPTKRGSRSVFFIAECESNRMSFRGKLKRDVLREIEEYHKKNK
jgi:hypothetical protein